MTFELWIPGNPVSKGRPRVNRAGWTFTPKKTAAAEKAIKLQVKAALGPTYKPDATSSWSVAVAFHCKNNVRGDLDNMLKLVLDALNGTLYADDKRVTYLSATLVSENSQQPGTNILATTIKKS